MPLQSRLAKLGDNVLNTAVKSKEKACDRPAFVVHVMRLGLLQVPMAGMKYRTSSACRLCMNRTGKVVAADPVP
jgi:hypothetical protein